MRRHLHDIGCAVTILLALGPGAGLVTGNQALSTGPPAMHEPTLVWQAQRAFYAGRYLESAEIGRLILAEDSVALAGYEIRSSGLLFELKRALRGDRDMDRDKKNEALAACEPCRLWLSAFADDTNRGRELARTLLEADPADDEALFALGKLDLNYLWLQLGVLGRRTGWTEFWEAKRSLDALVARDPQHVRARVARAWVDYIVGTSLPRGARWLLGGGNRQRALRELRDTAMMDAELFTQAEARFALWEMEQREDHIEAAIVVARQLVLDFPDNADLTEFLAEYDVEAVTASASAGPY